MGFAPLNPSYETSNKYERHPEGSRAEGARASRRMDTSTACCDPSRQPLADASGFLRMTCLFVAPPKLIRGEAVDQAGAARGLELVLTAAARAVRGVPGLHVAGGLEALEVVRADDRRAVAALGPVAVGGVAAGGRIHALRV